jgi:LPXTG-motif cell wall-anchored protein
MRFTTAATATAILVVVFAGGAVLPAQAVDADFFWDDGGADSEFDTVENWSTDVAPGADDNLIFQSGNDATQNLGNPFLIRSLRFGSAADFILAGNAITLSEGIFVAQPAGSSTVIHQPLNLTAMESFFNVGVDNTLNVNGDLTVQGNLLVAGDGKTNVFEAINGPGTIEKQGSGALVLAGDGSLDGLEITAGIVHVSGSLASADVLLTGGTLAGGTPGNLGEDVVGSINATGGRFSPGTTLVGSDPGTLYAGSVVGSAAAVYQVDLEGTVIDLIHSSGVFTPNNTELEFYPGVLPPVGTVLTIVDANGDITAGSYFTHETAGELSDGEIFTADGERFRIDYNTVTITLTYLGDEEEEEPAALPATGTDLGSAAALLGFVLLGGGAALVASRRRAVV